MSPLIIGFALVAIVLMVSALASGLVERAPLSFPMIFLGLGFLLGGGGLQILVITPHNPLLEIVAVVSLALVLFLDAVKVEVDELRNDWRIPLLVLGPGTLLTIVIVSIAAYFLVGTSPIQSLLLGAILASTDPVVLRDVLRDERIPRSVRRTLGIESGMNDLVVLPIVLILIALLTVEVGGVLNWIRFLGQLLILSPLVGLVVGGVGAWLMGKADQRWNIRREYQSLYGIGLVLAAYAAGQVVQGDGFLAAFFAGLAVNVFNVSLCDCFLEYGEVTAEMAMLLAFVLFGAALSTMLGALPFLTTFALALVVILIARPLALNLVLRNATLSSSARAFIGWFGPRGLNSLLLALLVVQAGASNAEWLLAIAGLVVVVSVVAHGASATPLSSWYGITVARAQITLAEERESTAAGLFEAEASDAQRISPAELVARLNEPDPPIILDVRSRAHYDRVDDQIPGSIRILPDQIVEWAATADRSRPIVAYCDCPLDATSTRVARKLQTLGFTAIALSGGYKAWKSSYPMEPKGILSTP